MWTLECDSPILQSKPISKFWEPMAHVIKTQTSGYGFDPAKSISWDDKKRNAVERVVSACVSRNIRQLLRLWAAGFKIEDKSISRKHATISVSAVKPGSGVSSLCIFVLCLSKLVSVVIAYPIKDHSRG